MISTTNKWLLTLLTALLYVGLGVYFVEKGFNDGAGMWFSLMGVAWILLISGMWTS